MLVVHHLNNSRSQRILWLLEELGLSYELRHYRRDPKTNLAPPELKAIHPLGKSPLLTDNGHVVFESGAIIDHVIRHHGGGRLRPDPASPDHDAYQMWLHYAEGSAMLPFMLHLYVSRLGDAGKPLHQRIRDEIANHLGYIEASLTDRDFIVGDSLTGADINLSFVGEIAGVYGMRKDYPHVDRWVRRLHARPAWHTALGKGGVYAFGD